jgi:hypothetical protein
MRMIAEPDLCAHVISSDLSAELGACTSTSLSGHANESFNEFYQRTPYHGLSQSLFSSFLALAHVGKPVTCTGLQLHAGTLSYSGCLAERQYGRRHQLGTSTNGIRRKSWIGFLRHKQPQHATNPPKVLSCVHPQPPQFLGHRQGVRSDHWEAKTEALEE